MRVKKTEKDCAKCKAPVLYGISRQEAIERMAKHYAERMEKIAKLAVLTETKKAASDIWNLEITSLWPKRH